MKGKKDYPRFRLIRSRVSGRTLDIGYVSGTLHDAILEAADEAVGLDTRTGNGKDRVRGDAKKMPLKGDSFDTVVAGELIEHLKTPENFLKECKRVLKSGGRCIITTPNKKSWVNRLTGSYNAELHFTLFDKKELVSLLEKHGFVTEELHYLPYTEESSEGSRHPSLFRIRSIIHSLVPDSLKEEMIVICRKKKD